MVPFAVRSFGFGTNVREIEHDVSSKDRWHGKYQRMMEWQTVFR